MSRKKVWAIRVAGAGLGAALLAGFGMSTASAAPAGPTGGQGAGQVGITRVTNVTPYAWTLCSTGVQYTVKPPKSVASGDTASWTAVGGASQPITSYCFTNPSDSSQRDRVDVVDKLSNGEHETAASVVGVSNFVDTFDELHAGIDTDSMSGRTPVSSDPHHLDVETWEGTVHIDAAKDPAAAAEALKHLDMSIADFDGPVFEFDQNVKPVFHFADGAQAGAKLINESSAPAKLVKGHETSTGQSTSLDGEVSASISAKIFGLAVKAAVSTGNGQDWGSSDTTKTTIDADIAPHMQGWLTKNLNMASLTGQISFQTAPGGISPVTYVISHLTVSRGGLVDPSQPVPPVNFSATQGPITNP